MVLKKRISLQWKIFLPLVVCLWAVIIGTMFWQIDSVRSIRDEMVLDQLSVIGSRIVDLYEEGSPGSVDDFAKFINKFYSDSENYDPLMVWVADVATDSVEMRVGSAISPDIELPKNKCGTMEIPADLLSEDFPADTRFIYSVHAAPHQKKRIYLMLPYTRRMQEVVSSRTTYYWLVFVAIGIFATIVAYVATSYFGRNLKLLRRFAYNASSDPNFVASDVSFPHNELGDISREIINIFNQRASEVERREKEHKVALHAIEEKERIKRDITSNINHELKTPVGVIQGYMDTIVNTPDMDDTTRNRFFRKVYENMHRLSSLINDITAITKLESDGKLINIEDVNFHDLVFSFANFIEDGEVLQDKMTFSYDIPLDCVVLGNDGLLTTVLMNFVKNSVAYSEGTICRLILAKEDDDFYYFTYYDNGNGVPPEHLPHMFERFYRVNAGRSRSTGGTGLGLSIVEVTITTLGGEISVQNHFPTGLEFTFSLPKFKKRPESSAPADDKQRETDNHA